MKKLLTIALVIATPITVSANTELEVSAGNFCQAASATAVSVANTDGNRVVLTRVSAEMVRTPHMTAETMTAAINMAYAGFTEAQILDFCMSQMEYIMMRGG